MKDAAATIQSPNIMRKKSKIIQKRNNVGYLFILPFFIAFFLFNIYPIISTFFFSFNKWDGVGDMEFIGIKNYINVFQDDFFKIAFVNTWIIWLINYIPQLVTALFLGVVLSNRKVLGKEFFRAVYYLPNLVTAASIGVLFKVLMDWQFGTINLSLVNLGILKESEKINFLMDPWITRLTVSLIQWWMWFGPTMILIMAGIKAIPVELFEAATVDGASKWQEFSKITLPMLRPTMLYITVTSLIGGMQIFDIPWTLTGGPPDNAILTMVMHLYRQAFSYWHFGYSSAIAYTLFFMIVIFSAISFTFVNRQLSK